MKEVEFYNESIRLNELISEYRNSNDFESLEETILQLIEVYDSLNEKGYDAISQLVGYLMSGDPGYISSYQSARKKITSIDRSLILEFLLKKGLKI